VRNSRELLNLLSRARLFDDIRGMARKVAAHESAMPERWQELLGKSFQVLEVAERVCTDLTALGGGADTSGGWSGELVFCHNDTQHGNVMFEPVSGRHMLIDFEYGGYNPPYYDLANLFCEIPADYSLGASPAGFLQPFPDGFPSVATQRTIVRRYLERRAALGRAVDQWEDASVQARAVQEPLYSAAVSLRAQRGLLAAGVPSSDTHAPPLVSEQEAFRSKAVAFAAGSHLFWGLWGVLQTRSRGDAVPPAGDFDYAAYAANRLAALLAERAA